jgi:hypothetical protein
MGELAFVFTLIGIVATGIAVVSVAGRWIRDLTHYLVRRVRRVMRSYQRRPSIWVSEPDPKIVDTTPAWYRDHLAELGRLNVNHLRQLDGPLGDLLRKGGY